MSVDTLRKSLNDVRNTFSYRLEKALFNVAERICYLLDVREMTRTDLAEKMNVSPAYVTKILRGNPNLTIKSLLKLSDALEHDISIQFVPKKTMVHSVSSYVPVTAVGRRFVIVSKSANAQATQSEAQNDFADAD